MSRRIAVVSGCAIVGVAALLWFAPRRHTPPSSPHTSTPPAQVAIPADAPTVEALPQNVEAIVARYRKTIVLLEEGGARTNEDQDRASITGKIIFQENHQALSVLSDTLTAEIGLSDGVSAPPRLGKFLDLLETSDELHDADKLVFRDVLADLAETLAASSAKPNAVQDLARRVDSDRKALVEIQSLYEKE